MEDIDPIEDKIINRSDSVKSAVRCLMSQPNPMDMEQLCSMVNLTDNQKTVVRRALMEIAQKDQRVKFVPARQAQFFYTEHKCPLRSKIALAIKQLEAELSEIVFQHNSSDFEEVCLKIEKLLNEVINLRS